MTGPTSVTELSALPTFRGRAQRRLAGYWWAALRRAAELSQAQLPPAALPSDGPPPVNRWSDRDPAAAARLSAARAAVAAIGKRYTVPVENLLQPDLTRKLCWQPPDEPLEDALRAGGARPWQIELTAEPLHTALFAHA